MAGAAIGLCASRDGGVTWDVEQEGLHAATHLCHVADVGGVPVQVIAQRLGHAQISMTLEVYSHALPDRQQDAAVKLGALLAGR